MAASNDPRQAAASGEQIGAPDTPPQRLDDQRKRLLAALLELSALMRRPEATGRRRPQLALGTAMRQHGLEQRHASALLTIALYGPMTITQLANRHHVTLTTASLVAVQLEKAGLIERREDPNDRRRTIVTIAKRKQRTINQGLNQRAAHLQRTLDRLTPEQQDGLITGLEILAEELTRSPD